MHQLVLVQLIPVCHKLKDGHTWYRAMLEFEILNCQEDSKDEQIAFKFLCLKNKQAGPSRTAAAQNPT